MNKHLSDAELQERMMDHTKRVVDTVTALFSQPARRQFGEADDAFLTRCEDRAANIYYAAEAEFLARVQDAWALTDVCKDEMQGVIDAVHDYRIARETWEAKVRG